ncbi:MAG: ferredoxin [Candidatus Sumerlaeia bacterium]|nr:ferredoxin [Candidatus Sumerlaeia bacterium]
MADKTRKTPGNVPGRYYVDEECILCGDCENRAPENFAMGETYAYVKKQPATPDEEEKCQEAMDSCPVTCIGNDGE